MNPMLVPLDLSAFLDEVEEGLNGALQEPTCSDGAPDGGTLTRAGRHLCVGAGGKRVRPLMVRLFADACGAPVEDLVTVAIAAELIHSASLLHDDVVDAGMFRRGRPTVNARWGNIVAVMTGDLLLTTALTRLAAVDARLTRDAIATVAEMTRAAIAEVEARGDLSLTLERLRSIAEGKTGSLFAWCGTAAAFLAGDIGARERFSAFGRRLGVAFQIADDVRDLTGTDQGKPQYADLQSRTPSVPILLSASADPDLRKRIHEAWTFSAMTPDRARELGTAVLCSGAVEMAIDRMNTEIEAAVDSLGSYATSRGGAELTGWARRLAIGVQRREEVPERLASG
jgi:octaprenyl-diphosphate synthase